MSDAAKGGEAGPSVGALLGSLASETGKLVRQEVQLASTEMSQKAKRATIDVGAVGAGTAILLAGALTLIAALVLGLGTIIPLWMAAAIVGGVVTIVGVIVVQRGLSALRSIDLLPRQTVDTLTQDKAWMKEQVR